MVNLLLDELPDDLLALVSSKISHKDLCNLTLTCRKFRSICNTDQLWHPQCSKQLLSIDLETWRHGIQSYKALFRFISGVKSLLGIWVHQNPELGNLVYVTWGFLSLVACRVVPQELGPRGLDSGLLWAPVFEIVALPDGSHAFFLHGRDRDDYLYPGRVSPPKEDCNVLLLEAHMFATEEPGSSSPKKHLDSPDSPLVPLENNSRAGGEACKRRTKFSSSRSRADHQQQQQQQQRVSFGRLTFGDRRRLLELLVHQVRIRVPALAHGPMLVQGPQPCKKIKDRHALLLWMYTHGDPCAVEPKGFVGYNCAMDSEVIVEKLNTRRNYVPTSRAIVSAAQTAPAARSNGFATYVKAKVRQMMLGSSSSQNAGVNKQDAGVNKQDAGVKQENAEKKVHLEEYLRQSSVVGLRLHATSLRLTLYKAWPIMSENRFALYKIPEQKPRQGREYAGLWGGTLGWPPGKVANGKQGNPLYCLLLSYDGCERDGSNGLLVGTKILEGSRYVVHPNGSAMFTVKINEVSSQRFPWASNGDGTPVDIVGAYHGEGIASGYGFRYPGATPGDLFVDASGRLSFVWRDSQAVLTMQRLDLEELLRRGERVTALSAIANFSYLTRANSNVFAGYSGGFAS